MEDYNDLLDVLKPKCEVRASDRLKGRIRRAAGSKRSLHKRMVLGFGAVAAIAVVMFVILVPTGVSAKELLENAISCLSGNRSMTMEIEVRTTPFENFRYIDCKKEFVINTIQVVYENDSVHSWRIDKKGRVACDVKGRAYFWLPKQRMGMVTDNAEKYLGYMSILLDPKKIIQHELELFLSESSEEYELERVGNNTVMTVKSSPKAKYHDGYLLNSSIVDSNSTRRYTFDTKSGNLVGLSISIAVDGKEVEVLRSRSITYNSITNADALLSLPMDIEFNDISKSSAGLSAASSVDAAKMILSAFNRWNIDTLRLAMSEQLMEMYRKTFEGCRLLGVGEPFKSGSSDCVFVPCELKLRDGTVVQRNLSMKLMPNGKWMMRGGL